MQVLKNKEYIVDIIDYGFEGEGIAKIDDFIVFIPNAMKNEKVKILIVKVNKNYAYGKILDIIEKSSYRQDSDCETSKRCGGCNLRHINYKETLKIKQNVVQNCINKAFSDTNIDIPKVKETIGMEEPYNYRNKLQYPLGIDKNNQVVMGVYANRTHEIIPVKNCCIQDKFSQKIANDIYLYIKENNISAYNENTCKGLFRHILIKIGKNTSEVMVVLVLNEKKFDKEQALVKFLKNKYSEIKTIVKNINNKNTNVILGDKNVVLYGNGYIEDVLNGYRFKISPLSFYQVNLVQSQILYNTAIKLAKLDENDIVFDLYCGIGTISICLSKYAKKVYGIEIIDEAIIAAKENANLNHIENIDFFAGDVEKILPEILEKDIPDVIFVDPPRKGLDSTTIENIKKISAEKIIYISCNPATLARDLKLLSDRYDIKDVQPVDLFCYTSHVECCTVLCRKETL